MKGIRDGWEVTTPAVGWENVGTALEMTKIRAHQVQTGWSERSKRNWGAGVEKSAM